MTQNCPKCGMVNSDTQKFCSRCGYLLFSSNSASSEQTLTLRNNLSDFPGHGGLLAGKYEVIREVGRGGMGVVYEALDIKLKRTVALKFLPRELLGDELARERFIHEAQAASALDHPNICTIYEIGESEDGQIYIAMAYCQGLSLKNLIRRGPLSPAETLSLALQIAEGLAAAHDHGIIHRDVKPANILVSEEGQAKLVDFGLAKLIGEARLTRPGTIMGTVAYMSPEQLRGGNVDARSDVWSLGVVIYEMLTGRLPFESDSEQAVAYSIVHRTPEPLKRLTTKIPPELAEIVEKALAKEPESRFPSAREMANALRAQCEGTTVHMPVKKSFSRRALITSSLAVLAVALILFISPAWRNKVQELAGLKKPTGDKHIALLPLKAISGNANSQIMADGLTALLSQQLGLLISWEKGSWISPLVHIQNYEVREAADARRLLGANLVLSGTIKSSGDITTVSIDIIDSETLRRFNTVSKTDSLANVATWQEDLALDTVRFLGGKVLPEDRSALASGGTTLPAAFNAYMRGLGFLSRDELDDARQAAESFKEAIQLDPSFSWAFACLGRTLWRIFALDGEVDTVRRAETYCREALRLGGSDNLAHLVLSRIYHGLGRHEEAVVEAKAVNPESAWGFDALINLAQVYDEIKKPEQAEAAYLEATKLRPGYWAGLSYLGFFYFFHGQLEKARDLFQEVARLVPDNINGLNNLGAVYYKLGDSLRAEEIFERSNAVKRNPDACSNLGHLYFYRGRYADAAAMSEAALAYEKNDPLLWGNLADACYFVPGYEKKSQEAYDRAIELAEKVLFADKGNAGLRSSLAVYLAKRGNSEKAQAEMAEALKSKSDDPTIVLKSVTVYELTGDRPRALEALEKYLMLKGPREEVLRDPFLAAIRQDPGYIKIMGRGDK